jgi:hypothetical protein
MTRFLYFLSISFFILGCSNHKKNGAAQSDKPLSKTHQQLDSLCSAYQRDYNNADNNSKNLIVTQYHHLLDNFLMDSLHGGIDSIRVTVDSVKQDDLTITTAFHTNNRIAFKYGLKFEKDIRSDWDSLYNFMKSLKVNSDTTLGFIYFGAHEINDPGDTSIPVFRFFAFPIPLNFGKK